MQKYLLRLLILSLCLAVGTAHADTVNSDFPVFWVAGDPTGIAHAFKGIAAFFGNGSFTGSIMASAMLSASLVGLLIALVSSALKTQFMVGQWFVGTVLAMAMFTPTTSITIKSFFDENSASVSPRAVVIEHVPFGIAYPAGMASFAAKKVGDGLMTWFTNPTEDGGALAEGANGLMSPLKLLVRLNGLYDCSSHQATICNNMVAFFNQCPAEAATAAAFREQTSMRSLFEDRAGTIQGYMEYRTFNPASNQGQYDSVYIPCQQGAGQIWAAVQAYLDGDEFAKDVIRSTSSATAGGRSYDQGGPLDIQKTKESVDALAGKLQNILADGGAVNNDIIANMVMNRVMRAAAKTASEVNSNHANRVFVEAMTSAKMRAVADQSGQASMFVSFMTQAMNAFSFLFAATAPIIVLVAMVMGLAGIKVYGSWLLFGVWSQSWLPVAALISYYVESNLWRRMYDLKLSNQLSMPNIDQFYDQISTVLYTGSTMMSAVPIITLSLISGSIYAMTSLASKSTGTARDYVDEKRIMPTAHDATNADHYAKMMTAGGGMHSAQAGSSAGMVRQQDADGAVTYSTANQAAIGASNTRSLDLAEQRSWAKVQAKEAAVKEAEQFALSSKMGTQSNVGHKETAQVGEKADSAISDENSHGRSRVSSTTVSAGANVGGKLAAGPVKGVKGSGVGGGIEGGITEAETWQKVNQTATKDSRGAGASSSLGSSAETGSGVQNGIDLSHDKNVARARQELESAKAEHSKSLAAKETAQREYRQAQSYGNDLKANIGTLATNAYVENRARASAAAQMGARAGGDEAFARLDANVQKYGGWESANAVQLGVSQAMRSGNSEDVQAGLGAAAGLARTANQHTVADAMTNEIQMRRTQDALNSEGTTGLLNENLSRGGDLASTARAAGVQTSPGSVSMPKGIGNNPFGGDPKIDREIAAHYAKPEIRENGRFKQEVAVYDEMVKKGISPSSAGGRAILDQAKTESAAVHGTTSAHHEKSMKSTSR